MPIINNIVSSYSERLRRQNDYKTAVAVRTKLRSFHYRQGLDRDFSRQRHYINGNPEWQRLSQPQHVNPNHFYHRRPQPQTRYYNSTNQHLVGHQRQPDSERLRIKKMLEDQFLSAMALYSDISEDGSLFRDSVNAGDINYSMNNLNLDNTSAYTDMYEAGYNQFYDSSAIFDYDNNGRPPPSHLDTTTFPTQFDNRPLVSTMHGNVAMLRSHNLNQNRIPQQELSGNENYAYYGMPPPGDNYMTGPYQEDLQITAMEGMRNPAFDEISTASDTTVYRHEDAMTTFNDVYEQMMNGCEVSQMPPNDDSTRTLVPQSPAHAKKLRGRFNFPPDVTKKYLETMYRKTLMYKDEREKRQQKLEEELEKSTLAEKDKSQFRKALLQHETNLLRGKRSKVTMGNFKIVSGLGCGAYGQVYLVQHKSNKKHFAMKVIKKDNVINEKELQRIRIERDIMIAAEDCQPWIVKMECCFQDSQNLFFIMEYMVGGDLLNLLIKEGVFKEETAIFYIAELVNAVEWIHSCGFVHRDIKPDNVLIDGRGHIKVADFGLASSYKYLGNDDSPQGRNFNAQNQGKKSYHRYHSVVGTPNYIAPEVLQAQEISRACDIWSIGVILYEMVYGKPPFHSVNVEEVPANIRNWRQTLEFPPKKASDQCKELIQKLICDKEYRLTIPEIKEHGLFKKIDFDTIRELEAPIKPTFDTEGDTRNFDAQAMQEVSNFDFSSENKSEYITRKYMNFTYVSNRGHFS